MGTPLTNTMLPKWTELPIEMVCSIINVHALVPLEVHLMHHDDVANGNHAQFMFAIEPKKWQAVLKNLHISRETRKAAIHAVRMHSSLKHIDVDWHAMSEARSQMLRHPLYDDLLRHFKTIFLTIPYSCPYSRDFAYPNTSNVDVEFHIPVPVRGEAITLTAINIVADKPVPEVEDEQLQVMVNHWAACGASLLWDFHNNQSSMPLVPTPLAATGGIEGLRQVVKWVRK
jgi:hypothetical protein